MTPTQSIPARGQARSSLLDLGRGLGLARLSDRVTVLPATRTARPFVRGLSQGRTPGAAGGGMARRAFFPCASITGRSRGRASIPPPCIARPRSDVGAAP